MPYHQRVDLRVNFGGTLQIATEDGRRGYETACLEARARQVVRYAVAPRITLQTPRGLLRAGEEVHLSDFEGAHLTSRDGNGKAIHHPVPAWRALRTAIEEGRVLEADNVPDEP